MPKAAESALRPLVAALEGLVMQVPSQLLVAYLRLADDLLAARGAELLVGPRLHALMFAQNLVVWRADP